MKPLSIIIMVVVACGLSALRRSTALVLPVMPRLVLGLRGGGRTVAWSSSAASEAPISSAEAAAYGSRKPQVIFILGGPGSGKGTQSARLAQDYGFVHLSAGELLREERARGSPDGKLIDEYIKDGRIVPVELSLGLLRKAMADSSTHRFLIDGFPRNEDNLRGWERIMGNVADVRAVLWLDCPEDKLLARLLQRGLSSGRTDDNEESARKRFKTYVETTLPVVESYRSQGLVSRIEATAGIDEVYTSTTEAIEPLVSAEVRAACSRLRQAAAKGNWEAYSLLSEPGMTFLGSGGGTYPPTPASNCCEDCYKHDRELAQSAGSSSIQDGDGCIQIMGKTAVYSHSSKSHYETRVWRLHGGNWRQVHANVVSKG